MGFCVLINHPYPPLPSSFFSSPAQHSTFIFLPFILVLVSHPTTILRIYTHIFCSHPISILYDCCHHTCMYEFMFREDGHLQHVGGRNNFFCLVFYCWWKIIFIWLIKCPTKYEFLCLDSRFFLPIKQVINNIDKFFNWIFLIVWKGRLFHLIWHKIWKIEIKYLEWKPLKRFYF